MKTTSFTFDGGRPAVAAGGNTTVFDFGFRPLLPEGHAENINARAAAPLVIEDDVFVGTGALVMKGVPICGGPIGGGAVVGAGSVRTQDVPRAVGAGNPATVVREL